MLGKRLGCLTNGGLLGGQRGVAEARKCQEQHRARKKQAGAAKEGYIVALSYVVEYCEGPGPGDRTYQNERVKHLVASPKRTHPEVTRGQVACHVDFSAIRQTN